MSTYERMDDESPQAFEAFAHYRDMGAQRSTAKVAHTLGKSKTLMDRWSGDHHWVVRAAAYDAEMDRAVLAEMREKHTQMAVDLHTLGHKVLQHWLKNIELMAFREDDKGRPIVHPRDLVRLIEVGIKLERLTRNEPDTIQKNIHAGPGDKAIELQHLAGVNMGDLVKLAKEAIHSLEAGDKPDAKSDDDEV